MVFILISLYFEMKPCTFKKALLVSEAGTCYNNIKNIEATIDAWEGGLMSCYYIIGVRMENRIDNALKFQETLTQNGCKIKARLGLHEVSEDVCANDGIIILQPCGNKEDVEALVEELNKLEGVTDKYIVLN